MAQFAGHINLFPAIVRETIFSGADPELAASALICISLLSGAGSEARREKVEREDRQRDDELCLAIWALFLQRPQIKTQPVCRGEGENRIVKRQQYF